jgi:two-component system sensor histidine kinase YesM
VGGVLYRAYINNLITNSSSGIMQENEQISSNIDKEINSLLLTNSIITYANDFEIIDMVTKWNRSDDPNERFELYKQIKTKLDYLFNYRLDVQSVMFFQKNKGIFYYLNEPVIQEADIRNMEWYKDVLKNKGTPLVLGNLNNFTNGNDGDYIISIATSPKDYGNLYDVQVVFVALKTNIFNKFLRKQDNSRLGKVLIMDDKDNIIASDLADLIGKNAKDVPYLSEIQKRPNQSFTLLVSGKKMLISSFTSEKTKWKVVNVAEVDTLTKGTKQVMHLALVLCIGFMLLYTAFSFLFFRGIVIPIHKLIKSIEKVKEGNFNTNVNIEGNYEIRRLGLAFNLMVAEVKKLIQQRDLKERERSKAEIAALQSQINPHFLYNTLGSIRLMAIAVNATSVKKMLEAFIKLLDSTINRKGEIIYVKEEIEYLKNYIYIMKFRYGSKFDVVFEIEENILNYGILRFILQPILENSIIHGVNDKEGLGLISIKGRELEGNLLFELMDNGIGMNREQIERLLTDTNKSKTGYSSIGISNVNRRIKLNYSESYGITIESEEDRYTNVKILLPQIHLTEESDA